MSFSPRHARVTFNPPDLCLIEAQRSRYLSADLRPHTIASYARDWRVFEAWCAAAGRQSLPADELTVQLYVTDLLEGGRRVATADRHTCGIRYYHRIAGVASPCGLELKKLLCGARRVLSELPRQKAALRLDDLRVMVSAIGTTTAIGARNCALLLFGFASALRRASLARLQLADVTFREEGLLVNVHREKQSRNGEVRQLAVPRGSHCSTCPVRSLRKWLTWRGADDGPLFTNCLNGTATLKPLLGNRICQIVQESAKLVGLDPSLYGAHSLRAGFVTEALESGASDVMIARQTGHRSLDTLRLYDRSRDLFRGHALGAIGL